MGEVEVVKRNRGPKSANSASNAATPNDTKASSASKVGLLNCVSFCRIVFGIENLIRGGYEGELSDELK